MSNQKTVEFRGCDNLVYAEVISDDLNTAYAVGTVKSLAPVAEISKTVENSSETHYYDNVGMIIIRSEGSDEITLTVPALPLATLADITGKQTDPTTGAYIDGEAVEKYFAIGYRLRLTDGTYRYVWRMKGSFSIPDETSSTENDGTDTNNQELTFTGVKTITKFENGGRAKAVVVDERDGLCDVTTWFDSVQTPDTLADLAITNVTSITLSSESETLNVASSMYLSATTVPANSRVAWRSSNPAVAKIINDDASSVTAECAVTGISAGTAIITATAGNVSAACTVTVTTPD